MSDQLGLLLPADPPKPSPKLRERPAERYDETHQHEYGGCGHHATNIGRAGCSMCLAGWPPGDVRQTESRFP